MITTYNEMPMGICPHCQKESQFDDWYEWESGSSLWCPECERTIHVVEKEARVMLRFSTTPETWTP